MTESAFERLDPTRIFDHHMHLLAPMEGKAPGEPFVSSKRLSLLHPYWFFVTKMMMKASSVSGIKSAQSDFDKRLVELVRPFPTGARFLLLALDMVHDESGRAMREKTDLYMPGDHLFRRIEKLNDTAGERRFEGAISIHPYRDDAIDELYRFREKQNVKYMKWLPNIMNIMPNPATGTPAYKKLARYYRVLADLKITLLSHTGFESSAGAGFNDPSLGNPLHLKMPLDAGVRVMMCHTGREGAGPDLENGGRYVSNFELAIRMMKKDAYSSLLFGDISAMTVKKRKTLPYLEDLLCDLSLHKRLFNGSDYPIPALSILNPTKQLGKLGLLEEGAEALLNEIFRFNPLLFDFVLKRNLQSRHGKKKFADTLFYEIEA